jgi:hypothetical protein
MSIQLSYSTIISKPKVLAVEGKDDQFFFEALAKFLNLTDIQVVAMQGGFPLKAKIASVKNITTFEKTVSSFGVAIDANTDYKATLGSLKNALSSLGLAVPAGCLTSNGNSPKITIMLVPSGATNGMLEDLCLAALQSEPIMECINNYFVCLEKNGKNQRYPSKARIHVYLASLAESDLRLGEAAKNGYIPFNKTEFNDAKTFLKML